METIGILPLDVAGTAILLWLTLGMLGLALQRSPHLIVKVIFPVGALVSLALALPGFLPVLRDPTADLRWLLLHTDRSGEIVDTAALAVQPSERMIVLRSPLGPQP